MLVKPLVRPIVRAIAGNPTASLGSGFSPTSLFADGSKGVVYDNNDLSSFYLDSAGTTAATVNGLVGLQLDKSANLALGAELVTNGDFSGGTTGWTSGATFTSTAAVSSGEIQVTATAAFGRQVQQFTTTSGKWYRATATIRRVSGSSYAYLAIATSGEGDSVISATAQNATATPVTVTLTFLATASTTKVCLACASIGDVGGFDNVSVVELAGNHRYQTTTGSKPVLRGTPVGSSLVTNGDFASGTGWTVNSGWAIGSGTLNATAVTTGYSKAVFAGATITAGKVYRITYTITSITAGGVSVSLGASAAYTDGTARSAVGTYVEYITAGFNGAVEFIRRTSDFTGSIDNVEVVDVSAGSVTAPYGLQYDGVDDFLQTAAVDFTATDKMFVCAGVRKLSSGVGVIAELGSSFTLNNGSFALVSEGVGSNDWYFGSRGTAVAATAIAGYPFPARSVLTGTSNIVGDNVSIRVNGAPAASDASDQGTGNYANTVLYFGRRAGSSNPLNGLDFGLVICGKTLTSTQISQTERYIAQRTGVTI